MVASLQAGREARKRALYAALDDVEEWLLSGVERNLHSKKGETSNVVDLTGLNSHFPNAPFADEAQVAIVDATNSTNERRDLLVSMHHMC